MVRVQIFDVSSNTRSFVDSKEYKGVEEFITKTTEDRKLIDPQHLGLDFTFDDLEKHSRVDIGDQMYDLELMYSGKVEFYDYYQLCIDYTISVSNTETTACMWNSMYACDRNCPHFVRDLETAVKCANLKTVAMALCGLVSHNVFDPNERVTIKMVKEWATENKTHGKKISKMFDRYAALTGDSININRFHTSDKHPDEPYEDTKEKTEIVERVEKFTKAIYSVGGFDFDKIDKDLDEHRKKTKEIRAKLGTNFALTPDISLTCLGEEDKDWQPPVAPYFDAFAPENI